MTTKQPDVNQVPLYAEGRRCPKCGCIGVGTLYVSGLLRRDCNRCKHFWFERPLDVEASRT